MKNKQRLILGFDIATFICALFALICIYADWRFMGDYPRLSSIPYLMTFTGLSNAFIGLVSLGCAITRIIKKNYVLPKQVFVLKAIALADITITFIITISYLAPHLGNEWWRLYTNASLFNHAINPLIAIIGFIFFEPKVETTYKDSFFSLIPMALYGVMYIINVYTHLDADGNTSLTYDIYGFMRFGVGVLILFISMFLLVSFAFTYLYTLQNKKKTY